MDDLEIMKRLFCRQNLLKQLPQFRNVPLIVAQLINEAPDSLGRPDCKGLIKRMTCSYDSKIIAEHEERLPNRVYNSFGIFQQLPKRFTIRAGRHENSLSFARPLLA